MMQPSPSPNPKVFTQFRLWCKQNRIGQKWLCEQTCLSPGCIHTTWNDGYATKSTTRLIYLALITAKYQITEAELTEMIGTFVKKQQDIGQEEEEK